MKKKKCQDYPKSPIFEEKLFDIKFSGNLLHYEINFRNFFNFGLFSKIGKLFSVNVMRYFAEVEHFIT